MNWRFCDSALRSNDALLTNLGQGPLLSDTSCLRSGTLYIPLSAEAPLNSLLLNLSGVRRRALSVPGDGADERRRAAGQNPAAEVFL